MRQTMAGTLCGKRKGDDVAVVLGAASRELERAKVRRLREMGMSTREGATEEAALGGNWIKTAALFRSKRWLETGHNQREMRNISLSDGAEYALRLTSWLCSTSLARREAPDGHGAQHPES
jgi:hypothetical protein